MPCKPACIPTRDSVQFCSRLCSHKCSRFCFSVPNVPIVVLPRPWPHPRPPPPLPPPLISASDDHPPGKNLLLLSLITTATLIGAIFMVCFLFKKLRQHRQSTRSVPVLFAVQGQNSPDDDDEEGPVLDHHIWYIHTVGLHQSVIDSITTFNYKKDDKLTDGSDCSICLGEFQEDESLRLLPKCSHAFHVPCIDTWLRSHKNCPLCRAPVVSNSNSSAAAAAPNLEPITTHPPPGEDTQMETEAVEEENRGDEETSGEGVSNSRRDSEIPIKGSGLSRTLSDLTENHHNREAVENAGEAMRRSVSLDSVSAMAIHQATANLQIPEEGSSSSGALVEVKNSVSRNVQFPKRGIGNQSLYNLVKSISFGRCVQKGAISMKRFSSGSRKLQWARRHYRSQSSVLPL